MKKFFYFYTILTLIIFVIVINLFLIFNSDLNHIIGINIILGIHLFISLICSIFINKIFKRSNIKNSKNFKKDIKPTFANSFVTSSIISILFALLIYVFFRNILNFFNLKTGLINYCVFASKIWFISSPFIGLEITIIKYFKSLDYYQKPIKILTFKLLTFFIISLLLYNSRQINCFIYAKPLCDIFFLFYYSKICFAITI